MRLGGHSIVASPGPLRAVPRWATACRITGRLWAPPGGNGRLLILIYHRVLPQPDPLRPGEVDCATFRWQMAVLAACFNVLPLDEALARMDAGSLPSRATAITFDDGYLDNHDTALPILDSFGLHATFFMTTGVLGGCMWNDVVIEAVRATSGPLMDSGPVGLGALPVGDLAERLAAVRKLLGELKTWGREARDNAVSRLAMQAGVEAPSGLMMQREHVIALAHRGMHIGAHTVNHPILSRIGMAEAEREIADSRDALREMTGTPVELFAYPNGRPGTDYLSEHVDMVRRLGFSGAVTTRRGVNRTHESSRFEALRFTPWDRTPERFAARLIMQYVRRAAS